MAIWTYEESRSADLAFGLGDQCHLNTCLFCDSPLLCLAGRDFGTTGLHARAEERRGLCDDYSQLQGCPKCGWWVSTLLTGRAPFKQHDDGYLSLYRACGTLRDLDLADISVPIEELRAYLLAKYEDRFHVHPKKYEDIVGSVFSDFGFRVRVTSYSGDDGIDAIVLDGNDDATIGIQVKRYRGKITAEQIRSFVGALVLQGLTTGVYVTTSSYQIGAERTVSAAQDLPGVRVSLMDAQRFYNALKITQRTSHFDAADRSAPYFRCWKEMSRQNLGGEHVEAPLVYSRSW